MTRALPPPRRSCRSPDSRYSEAGDDEAVRFQGHALLQTVARQLDGKRGRLPRVLVLPHVPAVLVCVDGGDRCVRGVIDVHLDVRNRIAAGVLHETADARVAFEDVLAGDTETAED